MAKPAPAAQPPAVDLVALLDKVAGISAAPVATPEAADDLDALLDKVASPAAPAASPALASSVAAPSPPGRPAEPKMPAAALTIPEPGATDEEESASKWKFAAVSEAPPLPSQWDRLLGNPAAQPAGSIPKAAPAPQEPEAQVECMEKQMAELRAAATASAAALEKAEKRLELLEARLDAVESGAKEELERAAAVAAARILREELAAMFAEGAE
jgi:hypothetical protein